MGNPDSINGILIVNKPRGMTSRAVVDQVGRVAGGAKTGHAGTLDPLASGVLIVCIGQATRLVEWIHRLPKSYRTVVLLGARSDTLDADGQIAYEADPRIPSGLDVEKATTPWIGEVEQMPPDYSALKVQGRRAYDLARAGRPVELAPRRVRIDRITVVRYEWPHLELEIDCGSGTYIRSIARDVGETLGCGGLVEILIRTRIGSFTIDRAVNLDELSAESIGHHLHSCLDAIDGLPRLALEPEQVTAVVRGQRLTTRDFGDLAILPGELALIDPSGRLVAMGEVNASEGWIQPRKVFVQ